MAEPLDNAKAPESSDAEIVSMMGMAMLDAGGLDLISQSLNSSSDPGQVVGQVLAQLIGQLAEFASANMGVDPQVFLQPDGFLDQILDYIERKLGLPADFSDQVYGETLEVIKAAAAQPAGEGPPAPGPASGGPAPLDQMGGM